MHFLLTPNLNTLCLIELKLGYSFEKDIKVILHRSMSCLVKLLNNN